MSRRLRDFRQALAELGGAGMDQVGERALLVVSADALRLAKQNASGRVLRRGKGALSQSIRPQITRTPGRPSLALLAGSPSVPYAEIHERGGTIHGKPWLRFRTARGWATVRSVVIPARPYLHPALQEAARARLPAAVHAALAVKLGVR